MWKDRFKSLLGQPAQQPNIAGRGAHSGNLRGNSVISGSTLRPSGSSFTRHSSGFEQFCNSLHGQENLTLLDLAGVSQANITFLTDLGHRVASDDILASMEKFFGTGDDFYENQQAASMAQRFLDQTLDFPDEHFDGVLVWDTLQFLTSPLLEETVKQILRVMRPGGSILAFFNADEKATRIPVCTYRIQDARTLLLTVRGERRAGNFFNNRMLERLFHQAQAVKFFLTRDHLREVIVRR